MDIQTAIQRRDQLKVDIGVMESRRATILAELKAEFGTDDLDALRRIRVETAAALEKAQAEQTRIEAELDAIFAGT